MNDLTPMQRAARVVSIIDLNTQPPTIVLESGGFALEPDSYQAFKDALKREIVWEIEDALRTAGSCENLK